MPSSSSVVAPWKLLLLQWWNPTPICRIPWYRPRTGVRMSRQRSSSVSCWSKNSPALNCSIPRISSGGAGSSQRARTGSRVSPPGTRLGGRADLRSRLLGLGVLRAHDPPEAELVLEELAHERILECFGQAFRSVRKRDLDAFV